MMHLGIVLEQNKKGEWPARANECKSRPVGAVAYRVLLDMMFTIMSVLGEAMQLVEPAQELVCCVWCWCTRNV